MTRIKMLKEQMKINERRHNLKKVNNCDNKSDKGYCELTNCWRECSYPDGQDCPDYEEEEDVDAEVDQFLLEEMLEKEKEVSDEQESKDV